MTFMALPTSSGQCMLHLIGWQYGMGEKKGRVERGLQSQGFGCAVSINVNYRAGYR